MYRQDSNRVFTVRGSWDIGQPFVCGKLEEVIEYALTLENGIEYFAEISNLGFKKISKKTMPYQLLFDSNFTIGQIYSRQEIEDLFIEHRALLVIKMMIFFMRYLKNIQ